MYGWMYQKKSGRRARKRTLGSRRGDKTGKTIEKFNSNNLRTIRRKNFTFINVHTRPILHFIAIFTQTNSIPIRKLLTKLIFQTMYVRTWKSAVHAFISLIFTIWFLIAHLDKMNVHKFCSKIIQINIFLFTFFHGRHISAESLLQLKPFSQTGKSKVLLQWLKLSSIPLGQSLFPSHTLI